MIQLASLCRLTEIVDKLKSWKVRCKCVPPGRLCQAAKWAAAKPAAGHFERLSAAHADHRGLERLPAAWAGYRGSQVVASCLGWQWDALGFFVGRSCVHWAAPTLICSTKLSLQSLCNIWVQQHICVFFLYNLGIFYIYSHNMTQYYILIHSLQHILNLFTYPTNKTIVPFLINIRNGYLNSQVENGPEYHSSLLLLMRHW